MTGRKKETSIGLGLVFGVMFGVIFDNIALGICFGLLFGAAAASRVGNSDEADEGVDQSPEDKE